MKIPPMPLPHDPPAKREPPLELPKGSPQPLPDCPRFAIGDEVYHKSALYQLGIVTGVCFYPGGYYYRICYGHDAVSEHYECELTSEKAEAAFEQ